MVDNVKKKSQYDGNNNRKKETLRITGVVILRILSYVVNITLTVLIVGMMTALIVGTVFAVYIKNNLDLEVDQSLLVSKGQDTTTRIYYMSYASEEDRLIRNGEPVELENERLYGSVNSLWADYDSIPENLIKAFIAIEDHRFMNPDDPDDKYVYKFEDPTDPNSKRIREETHNGVDLLGTGKAIANYFLRFENVRGASTITQQLIKNVTGEDQVTIQRKVEEIFRAINLEKQYSKQEILEMYLNIVYLGNNCYGVQTAANTYFGKDVSELDLTECAALAAIVKNPSRYEPLYHDEFTREDENGEEQKDGNKVRRAIVLNEMRHYGFISGAECEEAKKTDLNITYFNEDEETSSDPNAVHSWYVDSVMVKIKNDLMEQYGWTSAVASRKLYTSGYSIYIPMDPELQSIIETVYENEEYFPKPYGAGAGGMLPESAMVITDPYTGDVLALVGGRGEKKGNLLMNRATGATRPVGSSIKPISVYAPAMDLGIITPYSIYDDAPISTKEIVHGAGTSWQWTETVGYPQNLPIGYQGPMNIMQAVTVSKNTIAMRVLQDLTIDKSFDFMKNTLHMDSLIDSYTKDNGETVTDRGLAALALGQLNYGCTVMEMAGAYSMFPNNGLFESPNLYLYVKDSSGNIVMENKHYTEVAIKESTAKDMTKIMKNVMSSGTGTSVNLRHTVETAGKTGTANADFDRYFVGYTPYYIGAVWVGYDINSSLSAYGENPACTLWDTVMTMAHQKYIDKANSGEEPLKRFDLD